MDPVFKALFNCSLALVSIGLFVIVWYQFKLIATFDPPLRSFTFPVTIFISVVAVISIGFAFYQVNRRT